MAYICASAKTTASGATSITNVTTSTSRVSESYISLTASVTFSIGPSTGGNYTRYLVAKYNGSYYGSILINNETWWAGTITGFTRTTSINLPVDSSSSNSTIQLYVSDSSNSVPSSYGVGTTPMIWNGKSADGYDQTIIKNISWSAYVPPVYGPSVYFSAPSNGDVFTSGSEVTLTWVGSDGSNPIESYTLLKGSTTLLSDSSLTSYTDTITADTTYKIQVYDSSGRFGVSSISLKILGANGKPTIIGVGETNSNPGFSGLSFITDEGNIKIPIKWKAPATGNGNSVTKYSIFFDNEEIEVSTTIGTTINYTLNKSAENLINNKKYTIKIRAYDKANNYTESNEVDFYYINPTFETGPIGNKYILTDEVEISWPELVKNNYLNIKYSLNYYTEQTVATIEDEQKEYEEIQSNITDTFYVWENIPESIVDGSLVTLKVVGEVFYGETLLAKSEVYSASDAQFFKGEPPRLFETINFSIKPEDYYDPYNYGSPLNTDYKVESKEWVKKGKVNNFKDSLRITCIFPEGWQISSNYIDCARIRWKRGIYKGEEIISSDQLKNEDDRYFENNKFILDLNISNASSLFGDSNEIDNNIYFEIYSLYETKKDGEGSGIYISAELPSLSWEVPSGLVRAISPRFYKTGTAIPSLINENRTLNVNFIDGTVTNNDFKVCDLRSDGQNDVPIAGFKIYATLDLNDYKNGQVVKNYLRQTHNGSVNSIEFSEDKGFFLTLVEPLTSDYGGTANSLVEGYTEFAPNILEENNNEYLCNLFRVQTLKSIEEIKEFYYVITVIDVLKQESVFNYYDFKASYDFRLPTKLEIKPYLIKTENFKTFTDGKEQEGYLFFGQTEKEGFLERDWIFFEWYPAIKGNDLQKNPENYVTINGTNYLKDGANDPNFYTLYKWIDNNYTFKRLSIQNGDYKRITETIKVEEENEVKIIKYIGRYAMNLKNINISEYFNLTLMPSYIDDSKKEKMEDLLASTNEILKVKEGSVAKFHLSKFIPPVLEYFDRIRDKNSFIIYLKVNDWGNLKYKTLKGKDENDGISSKMVILNSSLSTGRLENNAVLTTEGTEEGEVNEKEKGDLKYDFSKNNEPIYDNMPFSTVTTTSISITRFTAEEFEYSENKVISTVDGIFRYYIPANFSTLSLRKNKVGINYSDLTNTEEALYIVAKDRIDSNNMTGNIAIYGDRPEDYTYPHVFSIQGNSGTKMPEFNREDGTATSTLNTASIYMGFYITNKESVPYRVGSFGMEKGYPYFVYKGKYYEDTNPGKNTYEKDENGNDVYLKKGYDNKDYFEKISIADLPIPIGSIVMFPKAAFKGSTDSGENNATLHKTYGYKTWYLCDGATQIKSESNATLMEILGLTGNLGTIPYITAPEGYIYIIKGDG